MNSARPECSDCHNARSLYSRELSRLVPCHCACSNCNGEGLVDGVDANEGRWGECPTCEGTGAEPVAACHSCGEDCGDDAVTSEGRTYCSEECRPATRADFTGRGPCRTCRARYNCLGGECWGCFSDRTAATIVPPAPDTVPAPANDCGAAHVVDEDAELRMLRLQQSIELVEDCRAVGCQPHEAFRIIRNAAAVSR